MQLEDTPYGSYDVIYNPVSQKQTHIQMDDQSIGTDTSLRDKAAILVPRECCTMAGKPHDEYWRRLALEHLPQMQSIIEAAEDHVGLWWSFKELVAASEDEDANNADVKAIFEYAWWCFDESGDYRLRLSEEVGTYFYEDLPNFLNTYKKVPNYVSRAQFEQLEPWLSYMLSEQEFEEFRSFFMANCKAEPDK